MPTENNDNSELTIVKAQLSFPFGNRPLNPCKSECKDTLLLSSLKPEIEKEESTLSNLGEMNLNPKSISG